MATVTTSAVLLAVAVTFTSCACVADASSRSILLFQEAPQDLRRSSYTPDLLSSTKFTYGEKDGYKSWDGICQQGNRIPKTPINVPKPVAAEATNFPGGEMSFNYNNFTGATASTLPVLIRTAFRLVHR